jgi:seryl-tRNA(Sec) selenium transferase
MMMASDSSQTPPSRLDPETLAGLRAALRAYLSKAADRTQLQAALIALAADARGKSMLPEQLLVVLKEVWNALPEVRAMTDASAQVSLLQRVVTMCIKEYYSAV